MTSSEALLLHFLYLFFLLPVLQVCVASSALTFFDTGLYQNVPFSFAEWSCQKAKLRACFKFEADDKR